MQPEAEDRLAETARILADPVPTEQHREQAKVSQFARAQRRRRRSQELLGAVQQLDVTTDPATQHQLVEWIQQHYRDREGGELFGLFARCYLGEPYVDHQLALTQHILEHFTPKDDVPPAFGAARALVRSPAYLFVEVYSDGSVIPVRANGDPVV